MADNGENEIGRRRTGWRIAGWSTAALILLVPLVAMQFTDEVAWTVADFVFAGAMLGGAGLVYELTVRKTSDIAYRAGVGVAVAGVVFLIWVNGAVGIIGSEDNPANLMYGGVLAVGIIGAVVVRFQPHGMALALLATAFSQVLVAVITLVFGWGSEGENWLRAIVLLNGFFVALWLVSAALFREAGRRRMSENAGPEG